VILLLLLAIVLIGIAFTLAIRAAVGTPGGSKQALAQVGAYGFGAPQAKVAPTTNPLQTRQIANRIGLHLVRRIQNEQARELRQLLNSGGYYQTTVTQYLGYRALAVVGLPVAVLVFGALFTGVGFVTVVIAAIAAGAGWILPKTVVERNAKKRTVSIDHEVPELVDLLVTTIEAGIGFGSALQLSSRRIRDPLGAELRLTLGEQAMGLTMNEALQNMLERTNRSTSMRAFVQAIVQGETLGVSIGKTLRDLAVDMRKRRRQAAEEQAQKAPIKLLFPLTFLILPAMMIVILGPAVRAVSHGLGGG
jgi:tight adherence protein C